MRKRPKITAPSGSCCLYARYSSHNQDNGNSIEAQIKACEAYAAANGLVIVAKYIDEARSGTNDRRECFQRMISDSEKGIFSGVIIHKIDRFARNQLDFLLYRQKLKSNGVRLLSVTENIDDTANGILLGGIMGCVSEYHSNNLNGEVLKGLKINAEHCRSTGGSPCLGYDMDSSTKQYVLNPYEAEIVRTIFEKYADGVGYGKLQDYLNSMGFRTKQGNSFGKNSLYSILSNEKYTGKYIYNKRHEKDVTGRRNPQLNPEEEWIVVPGGVPAIISQELFDKVQAKMANNAKRAGMFKSKNKYLLSGLVYCGECGYAMHGNTRRDGRHGAVYSSYDCSGKKRLKCCDNRGMRREYLDNYVISELYGKALSNLSILEITNKLNDYNRKMAMRSNSELETVRRELDETERKISRVVKLATETDTSVEIFKKELHSLKDGKIFLESRLNELRMRNAVSKIPVEVTAELLEKSRDIIKTHDLAECRDVITAFVDRVIVYSGKVEVTFKIMTPDDGAESLSPMRSEEAKDEIRSDGLSV
jgi:site-specific DNA recombinase